MKIRLTGTPAEVGLALYRLRDAFSVAEPLGDPQPTEFPGLVALDVDAHL